MMNWYPQLTQLILSFYREDQSQLQRLYLLKTCKLSRRWGVLQIQCASGEIADAVVAAIDLLREPIAELRLAQQIKVTVKGSGTAAILPVKPSRHSVKS